MQNDSPEPDRPSYVSRVFTNDTVRKGLAGVAAAILVGAISEALWPSS